MYEGWNKHFKIFLPSLGVNTIQLYGTQVTVVAILHFYLAKRLPAKDIHKKISPIYSKKCLPRKAFYNRVENFFQRRSKDFDNQQGGHYFNGFKVIHILTYKLMHWLMINLVFEKFAYGRYLDNWPKSAEGIEKTLQHLSEHVEEGNDMLQWEGNILVHHQRKNSRWCPHVVRLC